MRSCRLVSISRDMVGNNVTVKAEIYQQQSSFKRIEDTIELEIDNGVGLSDEELLAHTLSVYELAQT